MLLYFAGQHGAMHQDLPCPAGGVGYLSYEFARFCDDISLQSREEDLTGYDGVFLFGHVFLVFDHYTDLIYLIGLNYAEHEVDLEQALDETEEQINDLNFNYLTAKQREYEATLILPGKDREQFCRGVEFLKKEIVAGNLLQAVLSRRLEIQTEQPAIEAYRNLRSSNPSPYLFYLDFGEYQIFGSSPEMHVKVKEGRVQIRPIAGTRRRGADNREDEELARELQGDEKEQAEHLMLLDLARNDLGRFCKPGSVEVTEDRQVEKYSHVMHMVSRVEGELKQDKNGTDAIRATFPAGTVSGAPKIRAMETLDKLESRRRGFYAGLVGYFEPEGQLDSCITIRSALKKGDRMYIQAGAGIVYDSDAGREYEETREKLGALAKALGVEV